MWIDLESPGCLYDCVDCSDCGRCESSPLQRYYNEKWETELSEMEIRKEKIKRIIENE